MGRINQVGSLSAMLSVGVDLGASFVDGTPGSGKKEKATQREGEK